MSTKTNAGPPGQPVGSLDSAELTALVDAAQDLASPRDLVSLFEVVARQGRRLLGVPVAFVATVTEPSPILTVKAADGLVPLPGPHLDGDESGEAPASSHLWWTQERPTAAGVLPGAGLRDLAEREGLHTMIGVRLGHLYGSAPHRSATVLCLADRRCRTFTANEHVKLMSFARLAAAALEKTHLLDVAVARLDGLEQLNARVAADLSRLQALRSEHYRFIELAVARGDAHAFVDEADRRLGAGVHLCTADGLVVASSRPAAGDAVTAAARGPAGSGREPVQYDDDTWVVPVLAGDRRLGILVVTTTTGLTGPDRQILPLIGQAAAVILRQLYDSTDGQGRRVLLDELITTPRPPAALVQRAGRLGVRLDGTYAVVVLRPDGVSPYWASAWGAAFAGRYEGLFTVHDDDVVLLLPGDTDPAELARTAADEAGALFGRPVTAAASATGTAPGVVAARYRQAVRSLEVMILIGLSGRGASAPELGFLPDLLAGREGVDQFVDDLLRPVLDYDRRRGADLVRTLDGYFRAGQSPTNAAELLHMHPNTVTRRLERVKKLLGPDWQDPSRALEIQLALRLHRLLTRP
ncbi:helix-turn-helix domain-containing protein [Actinoplanes sp. NPDC051411]|uniref:helix-turn-helix domain-containing protein n=1 Tax=Actinoplanes sp. NPDC051411 TaxID=3155522 RepID=UPI003443A78D